MRTLDAPQLLELFQVTARTVPQYVDLLIAGESTPVLIALRSFLALLILGLGHGLPPLPCMTPTQQFGVQIVVGAYGQMFPAQRGLQCGRAVRTEHPAAADGGDVFHLPLPLVQRHPLLAHAPPTGGTGAGTGVTNPSLDVGLVDLVESLDLHFRCHCFTVRAV